MYLKIKEIINKIYLNKFYILLIKNGKFKLIHKLFKDFNFL